MIKSRYSEHDFPAVRLRTGLYSWRAYGGDEPPQQATSTTTVQQQYSPEESAARAKIFSEGERAYNATSEQIKNSAYPGAKPVDFSADTLAARDRLRNWSTGTGQGFSNMLGSAASYGLESAMNPMRNWGVQGVLDANQRQLFKGLTDTGGTLAKIRGGFGDSLQGSGDSSRQGIAEGLAMQGYAQALGDSNSKILSSAYKDSQDTFARTLALAPQIQQAAMSPMLAQAALGQQQEGQDQAIANYNANAGAWKYNAPWAALGNWANIVNGMANPSTTTTGQAPVTGGGGMNPLGLGLTALSLAMPGGGSLGGGLIGSLFG